MQLENEYQAIRTGPAIVDRSYRTLLEVTGTDRASWLHNLTTNQVKNLSRGEGNYAFVLNIQGRIVFDVNVLIRAESIWLDLDRRFLETAKKHFSKYIITEDVTVVDRSDEVIRFGLVGDQAGAILAELGAANAAAMPALGQTTIEWNPQSRGRGPADDQSRDCQGAVIQILIIRHDFCGPFAVEMFVPANRAAEFRNTMMDLHHAIPVGDEAVQIHRIEAGIPWPGHEITDEYLPAETRQLDRAVNYQKGCYLGQEVVERMRSRAVVARQLVGLRLDGSAIPLLRSEISNPEGKSVGVLTSSCHSLALDAPIALAYVKTASSGPGSHLTIAGALATIVDLPFRV